MIHINLAVGCFVKLDITLEGSNRSRLRPTKLRSCEKNQMLSSISVLCRQTSNTSSSLPCRSRVNRHARLLIRGARKGLLRPLLWGVCIPRSESFPVGYSVCAVPVNVLFSVAPTFFTVVPSVKFCSSIWILSSLLQSFLQLTRMTPHSCVASCRWCFSIQSSA